MTLPFNENTLREHIVKQWGEAGAHIEVYDQILKVARENVITFPVTIQTVKTKSNLNGEPIQVNSGTSILCNKGGYWLCAYNKEILIPNEEFNRLWPVIEFHQLIGKNGAWFKLKDKTKK